MPDQILLFQFPHAVQYFGIVNIARCMQQVAVQTADIQPVQCIFAFSPDSAGNVFFSITDHIWPEFRDDLQAIFSFI